MKFYQDMLWGVLHALIIGVGGYYLYDLYSLRTPPITTYSSELSSNTWHIVENRTVLFVDIDHAATEKRDQYVWSHDHLIHPTFHPIGVFRFREGIFKFPDDLPIITLPSPEGAFAADNPSEITVHVPESRGARKIWLYGCVAAWAMLGLDAPSCFIELMFDSGEVLSYPFRGQDIGMSNSNPAWPGTPLTLAFVGPKVHFMETSLELPTDKGLLTDVRFRDTGSVPSDLFMGITLEK